MDVSIRALTEGDRAGWFDLWRGYLAFYRTELPEAISESTFRRLLDEDEPMWGLLALDAEEKGRPVGMLNYVLHANTWTDRPVCYLEDLFVSPVARGNGVGRGMIEALIDMARVRDWHRVYWMTKRDNATARLLYDRIAPVTDWVRYDVNTSS